MPYINVRITPGATREQKQAIVEDITSSLVRNLGRDPLHIHVTIDEVPEENWGFAGMLTDEYRKRTR